METLRAALPAGHAPGVRAPEMPKCWIAYQKKNGAEGGKMPITSSLAVGRGEQCEVVIRLPDVELKHVQLTVDDAGSVWLENFGKPGTTTLNGAAVSSRVPISHDDEMNIRGRVFRFTIQGAVLEAGAQHGVGPPSVKASPKRSPLHGGRNRSVGDSPLRSVSAHAAGGQENALALRAVPGSSPARPSGAALPEAAAEDVGEPVAASPAKPSAPASRAADCTRPAAPPTNFLEELKSRRANPPADGPPPPPPQPKAAAQRATPVTPSASAEQSSVVDELSMAMHKRRHLLSPANSDESSPQLPGAAGGAAQPAAHAQAALAQPAAEPESARACPVPTPRSLRVKKSAARTPTSAAPPKPDDAVDAPAAAERADAAPASSSAKASEEEDDATVDLAELLGGNGAGESPMPLLASRIDSPQQQQQQLVEAAALERASPACASKRKAAKPISDSPLLARSSARGTRKPPTTPSEAAARCMLDSTSKAVREVEEALRPPLPSPSLARSARAAAVRPAEEVPVSLQAALAAVRQPTPLKEPAPGQASARGKGHVRRSSVGGSPNLITFDQTLYGPLAAARAVASTPVMLPPPPERSTPTSAVGNPTPSLLAAFAAVSTSSPALASAHMPTCADAPIAHLDIAGSALKAGGGACALKLTPVLHKTPAALRAGEDDLAASAKRQVAQTPELVGTAHLDIGGSALKAGGGACALKLTPALHKTPAALRAGEDDLAASAKRQAAQTPASSGSAQAPTPLAAPGVALPAASPGSLPRACIIGGRVFIWSKDDERATPPPPPHQPSPEPAAGDGEATAADGAAEPSPVQESPAPSEANSLPDVFQEPAFGLLAFSTALELADAHVPGSGPRDAQPGSAGAQAARAARGFSPLADADSMLRLPLALGNGEWARGDAPAQTPGLVGMCALSATTPAPGSACTPLSGLDSMTLRGKFTPQVPMSQLVEGTSVHGAFTPAAFLSFGATPAADAHGAEELSTAADFTAGAIELIGTVAGAAAESVQEAIDSLTSGATLSIDALALGSVRDQLRSATRHSDVRLDALLAKSAAHASAAVRVHLTLSAADPESGAFDCKATFSFPQAAAEELAPLAFDASPVPPFPALLGGEDGPAGDAAGVSVRSTRQKARSVSQSPSSKGTPASLRRTARAAAAKAPNSEAIGASMSAALEDCADVQGAEMSATTSAEQADENAVSNCAEVRGSGVRRLKAAEATASAATCRTARLTGESPRATRAAAAAVEEAPVAAAAEAELSAAVLEAASEEAETPAASQPATEALAEAAGCEQGAAEPIDTPDAVADAAELAPTASEEAEEEPPVEGPAEEAAARPAPASERAPAEGEEAPTRGAEASPSAQAQPEAPPSDAGEAPAARARPPRKTARAPAADAPAARARASRRGAQAAKPEGDSSEAHAPEGVGCVPSVPEESAVLGAAAVPEPAPAAAGAGRGGARGKCQCRRVSFAGSLVTAEHEVLIKKLDRGSSRGAHCDDAPTEPLAPLGTSSSRRKSISIAPVPEAAALPSGEAEAAERAAEPSAAAEEGEAADVSGQSAPAEAGEADAAAQPAVEPEPEDAAPLPEPEPAAEAEPAGAEAPGEPAAAAEPEAAAAAEEASQPTAAPTSEAAPAAKPAKRARKSISPTDSAVPAEETAAAEEAAGAEGAEASADSLPAAAKPGPAKRARRAAAPAAAAQPVPSPAADAPPMAAEEADATAAAASQDASAPPAASTEPKQPAAKPAKRGRAAAAQPAVAAAPARRTTRRATTGAADEAPGSEPIAEAEEEPAKPAKRARAAPVAKAAQAAPAPALARRAAAAKASTASKAPRAESAGSDEAADGTVRRSSRRRA